VPNASTTVYDLNAGRVAASLPGQPPRLGFILALTPITKGTGTMLAALEQVPGCDGTVLYAGSTPGRCIVGAFAPAFSPDGSSLALTRRTRDSGHFRSPAESSAHGAVFEVVIIDVRTGAERVVAQDLYGSDYPMPARWNDAGTYLLLRSPFNYGP
jgi:hypothetical protein